MNVCGIDVHKIHLWVHIKDDKGNDVFATTFRRNPKGLQSLKRLCQQNHVSKAIMESTSTYWKPVYQILDKVRIECAVVNAYQLKVLGKHKTDDRDAELLATWGLLNVLNSSFIPSIEVHQLRELVRTRVATQNRKGAIISRMKTMLEGSCPGVTEALKNLNLLYAQLFLESWGQQERVNLTFEQWVDTIDDGRVRKGLIRRKSVLGYWWDHPLDKVQQYLLDYQMRQFQFYRDELIMLETLIGTTLDQTDLKMPVYLIKSIPGIGFLTAVTIAAELGSVERFNNGREAAASCGLTPKLKGSGGKTHTGRITKHGPKSVRRAVYIACKSVIRFSPSHNEFYQRIKRRRGGKRALIALCKKLIVQAWTMWSRRELFKANVAA
ncbi:MAG: IS110 family transposase [Candidatus Korarchaeota archaeon]|nr:IS110 family transposase [Candidatus Korarchaeota archaeon]